MTETLLDFRDVEMTFPDGSKERFSGIMGQPIEETRLVPDGPWQEFKQRRFPRWLKRLWPVRTREEPTLEISLTEIERLT